MVLKQFLALNLLGVAVTIGTILSIQRRPLLLESQSTVLPVKMQNIKLNGSSSTEALPCNLLPHPAPMILMSFGRSGTSSMWQVLSKLSGEETVKIFEYTGGSTEKSRIFFRDVIHKEDMKGDWLIKYLCHQQKKHPDAGVIAFKWKPYETLFEEEKALQGLTLLGRLKEVQIKVVRSKRNLLDVIISRRKHKISQQTHGEKGKIRSHCQKGDEKCVKEQLLAGSGIELPTHNLLKELMHLHNMEERTDQILEQYNVPTIYVSFEKLFTRDEDTSEWRRIFDFLNVGPRDVLTRHDIDKAGHAATSIPMHNVTLSNYDEVREILIGTDFEHLLH